MGSFPRSPHDLGRNFWVMPDENRPRAKQIQRLAKKGRGERGMFDIRNYRHMDVVVGAGLGGGSLIYANVFLEPPTEIFDKRWPTTAKKDQLQYYYGVAKEVLGARPIPTWKNDQDRRFIQRTKTFQDAAREMKRDSELLDLMVFFGNDFDDPAPIGHQSLNRHGALQTSCVYCAECDIGCNYHSKNTLDLNYLHVAEHEHDAIVKVEHLVQKIVPVDERDADDNSANGQFGYRIYFQDLKSGEKTSVLSQRVVLSAGTLGSTEMLLRCRDVFNTLPNISKRLGQNFSGNGDFLSFVLETEKPINPNYGPVITQRIDFNLFDKFIADHAFIMEDASYPAIGAWLAEGLKPRVLWGSAVWRALRGAFKRWLAGRHYGSITYGIRDLLGNDISYHTGLPLCMGYDKSDGVMTLDDHNEIDIDWPYKNSMALYDGILGAAREFGQKVGAKETIPLLTWLWPARKNITVHALGGCIIGETDEKGVTSSHRDSFGQVFNYEGLYVADGAICPTAVGANPTATISALSEMVAEGITGIKPDADLKG